jgi:hypothetical protein
MTTDLDKLLARLKRDLDQPEQNAETYDQWAARAALTAHAPIVGAVPEQMKQRRARRDIRELVRRWCECHVSPESLTPDYIASNIGCRKSRVEAALKKLEVERASERIAMGPPIGGISEDDTP